MKRVVGLEISTDAVRAVELGGRKRLRRAGMVGLAPGAVVAGEVIDPAAVTAALRRLWRDGRFRTRNVIVGFANARAVVRAAELPALPEAELRSALRFHVADLIPWPVEDAELDCQLMPADDDVADGRVRVLLVAAQQAMLTSLLTAVHAAGLRASRVEPVPLALIDSLGAAVAGTAEAIVDVGGGVTNVVVHEAGVARFARTMSMPTTRLSRDHLGVANLATVPPALPLGPIGDDASFGGDGSALSRQGRGSGDQVLEDVLDSLEFHLAQPGTLPISRIVVVGAGEGSDLRARIAEHTGAVVVEGNPFAALPSAHRRQLDVPAAAQQYSAAVGLALGEMAAVAARHRIDLLPRHVVAARARRKRLVLATLGLVAVAAGLVGLSVNHRIAVSQANGDAARVERQVAGLEREVATYRALADERADLDARRRLVQASLAGDVAWTRFVKELTAALPADVWLTSFSATRGVGLTPGVVTVTAKGADQAAAARFLQRLAGFTSATGGWVSSSSRDTSATGAGQVTFNASANLTPAAESGRAASFGGTR